METVLQSVLKAAGVTIILALVVTIMGAIGVVLGVAVEQIFAWIMGF